MTFFEKLKEKIAAMAAEKKIALTAADIDALVGDQEIVDAFEEHNDEITEAATTGLSKKNSELLKEKKALQEKVKNGTKEDLTDLEDKISKLTEDNEKVSGLLAAKEKELKNKETKYTVEQKNLADALAGERGKYNSILLENALSQGLGKVNIDKAYVNVVRSHLKNSLTIVEENGERKAVAKYQDADGKEAQLPFTDYVEKVWAPSDEGKAFIKSQASGGAGANKLGAGGTQKSSGGAHEENATNPFEELKFAE